MNRPLGLVRTQHAINIGEMDAAELLKEFRAAQEAHARALAEVGEVRARLEAARLGAERARAEEARRAREVAFATEQLVQGLRRLDMRESSPPLLPAVADYLVEYHANIGCYHCYLRIGGDQSVDTSALSVSVDLTSVAITHAGSEWWSVQLERKVDAERCSIADKGDHVYIRLPLVDSDKETADGFSSFSQTTPNELRLESYGELCCRGCSSVLTDDSLRVEKVLPLPSENWMEMFDFWGSGIGSFEHIPREGICAQQHRIYVGESHILVHEQDLRDQAIADAPSATQVNVDATEEPRSDWQNVSCSQCNVVIGQRREENASTIRLMKHLVNAIATTDTKASTSGVNVFERYTIDSTISAQMLHAAESDGVFRFRLSASVSPEEQTERTFQGLQLQLLNWDTKIQTQAFAPDFPRVLRVVYSDASHKPLPVLVNQAALPPMLRTHEIAVTPSVGAEIAKRLELSTRLLPASQRDFNRMAVGYLYA